MDIDHWREKIDAADAQIVKLLAERFEAAGEIGKIKSAQSLPVFVPGREEALLEKLEQVSQGEVSRKELETIYREIISCGYSRQGGLTIGYLSDEGVSLAKGQFGGMCEYVGVGDVEYLVEKLTNGEVDYAVVGNFDEAQGVKVLTEGKGSWVLGRDE